MKGSEVHIVVVGGGLAGLVSSILLARYGHEVVLIEKKVYPFHRVCGEYISNEVLDFLAEKLDFPLERCGDRVGMVTPRVMAMIINEAYFTVQEGTATKSDIDLGMQLGTNYLGHFDLRAQLLPLLRRGREGALVHGRRGGRRRRGWT